MLDKVSFSSFRVSRVINAGSLMSPELEEALNGIKKVIIAFEKDIRDDVQWDWATDRVPSAIVSPGGQHESVDICASFTALRGIRG